MPQAGPSNIGVYERHPVHIQADVREMNEAEWAPFRNSIGQFGIFYPIIRWERKILNGANRLRACLETNQPPRFVEFEDMALFRKCKTRAEQEAAARSVVKMVDLDRRQLKPGEIAAVLVRLYPPKPRGREAKSAENAGKSNPSNDGIGRPGDEELARQSGISPATIQRARQDEKERERDEKKVKEGCIPAIRKLVGKEFPIRDAANISGLPDGEQKQILALALERKCGLTAAMAKLPGRERGHRNEEYPGASAKATGWWVNVDVFMVADTAALAVQQVEKANDCTGKGEQRMKCVARAVGPDRNNPLRPFVKCFRCGGLLFEADGKRQTAEGTRCANCPDGRSR